MFPAFRVPTLNLNPVGLDSPITKRFFTMKLTTVVHWLALGLFFCTVFSGCRKRPGYFTNIPPGATPNIADNTNAAPLAPTQPGETNVGFPLPDPTVRQSWPRNAEIFKAYTVHFDFDSSAVKSGEKSKVAAVADYLKSHPQDALEVDGHCDERGTEEYNRSLGERRALALREQLVTLGIEPGLIDTVTYGKDRPLQPGHDESAWKQNRRGEFLLEEHPK
jgi:peptidoglycan-associated lipoprotein